MPHIFISYSRVDGEIAERIVDRLRRVYGLSSVWYDDELHGGVRWWQEILRQIAECDVFVYLLSNESVTSLYCHAEFTEATRLQKPIVTVQIRDRTELSNELSQLQYVNMKQGINDDSLARLIGSIQRQSELPKKRRALWTPATSLPVVPSAETAIARVDVDTPPLALHRAPDTSTGDRGALRIAVIGALLTGIFGIITVIVGVVLPILLDNKPTDTPSVLVASPTPGMIATVLTPVPTDYPTLVSTTMPTNTNEVIPTAIYTDTSTQIAIPTDTETATWTPSHTPTSTLTPSHTPTSTLTPSHTPTSTLTPSHTLTSTLTPSHAPTSTLTPSYTPTNMPIPIGFPGNQVTHNADWVPHIQEYSRRIDDLEMVLVPSGCYRMGDASVASIGDGGQQCFDMPFYISIFEITNEQFAQHNCLAAQPSSLTGDNLPRGNVTWFEARDCAAKMGGRLPTEAEWEYVARGPDNWRYPWGNVWNPDRLIWFGNSGNQAANVGSKANGLSWVGAYDLAGNVWEWTSSIYKDYPYTVGDGRENSDDNNNPRIVRGGSWVSEQSSVRGAFRANRMPNLRYDYQGFRIVMSVRIAGS